MRLVTDVFEFCARDLPRWNTISISATRCGRPARPPPRSSLHAGRRDRLRRGGCRARARRRRLCRVGCRSSSPRGRSCSRRSPSSGVARRMWATIMKERFGATNPRSMMCRFHVQTAGSSLTAQSIDNNVVRTTIQALSAVLGGAQSLHTNSRDEALALPTEEGGPTGPADAAILAYEAGVTEHPTRWPAPTTSRASRMSPRGGSLGLPRRDRIDGRDARSDRARLPAARDPGSGVSGPAGPSTPAIRSSSA